jgi:hypothetical protein
MGERFGEVHQWSKIRPFLEPAISSIRVREINGLAGEVLDYKIHEEAGLNVVAIGGDKLSRGLTLEGLSVSYFLRASKMYDTLMQMGRWFGYRPRYLDLCRLYTTSEMEDWFGHIAEASEELRDDFDRMAASGATPREFGLRVRSHPTLMVTSRVKMRHGSTIQISFEGDISETINFWRTKEKLDGNWDAAIKLIESAVRKCGAGQAAGKSSEALKWRHVGADEILDFLRDYTEHEASKKVKTKLLGEYIQKERARGRLVDWTLLLASGQATEIDIAGINHRLVERSWHLGKDRPESSKQELISQGQFRIRRLVSPTDELADLSPDEKELALDMTVSDWELDTKGRNKPDRPGGVQIRHARDPKKGLLILYPIDSKSDGGVRTSQKVEEEASGTPIIGFAISFPHVSGVEASKVNYTVNNVYWEHEFGDDDG